MAHGHHGHHKHYHNDPPAQSDDLRLEAVTVSVGFDDLLDATLSINHPHLDTMIVVTSHDDTRTQGVAKKHGAICVQTDLHKKHGRNFNKGAAINAGFNRFQFHGWRLHLDSDIALPDNFRRLVFNHAHLDTHCIYGMDRIDVIGTRELARLRSNRQHNHQALMYVEAGVSLGARYVSTLHGYVPIGYFQMFHASCAHDYPWSLGTAEHDDVAFAIQWPESQRRLLPHGVCYHLLSERLPNGQNNWDGRKQKRLDLQQ
jgi:glycosyltransferase involved in cell wall biosynthesis